MPWYFFLAFASRAFDLVSILAWRAFFKWTQPIRAAQLGLFFIYAPRVAIPFRHLAPEIDDLLFE